MIGAFIGGAFVEGLGFLGVFDRCSIHNILHKLDPYASKSR